MSNNKWAIEDKLRAAFAYIITGNTVEASPLCGIPDRTIREWTEEPWWADLIAQAKSQKNAELDASYTRIIAKAILHVEDRIDNGDEVNTPSGPQKKKMSGKDLATIAAIFQDKRAIIRGEPTSISKRINEKDRLEAIKNGLGELDKEENSSERAALH